MSEVDENPSVPVRALERLDAKLHRYGMNLLRAFDIDMLQEEETRKAGEPTVRLGIGIYRFEDREDQRKAERGRVEVPTRSQRDRRSTPSIRRVGRERRVEASGGHARGRAHAIDLCEARRRASRRPTRWHRRPSPRRQA